jgi:DNA-binding IclR family transcriptional regulator
MDVTEQPLVAGQASPPTRRVTSVVELLVERPLTHAEVSRTLGISPATAHAILRELVATGWASRDEASRRFTLGPRFQQLSRLVSTRGSQARSVLGALVADLGTPASLSSRAGSRLVVDDVVCPPGATGPTQGQSAPFLAPLGAVFAAHLPAADQDRWLSTLEEHREPLATRLAQVRRDGFSAERHGSAVLRLVALIEDLDEDLSSEGLVPMAVAVMRELAVADERAGNGAASQVSTVSVPVFGAGDVVTHTLNAHPGRRMTAHEVRDVAGRLTSAARLLRESGGP